MRRWGGAITHRRAGTASLRRRDSRPTGAGHYDGQDGLPGISTGQPTGLAARRPSYAADGPTERALRGLRDGHPPHMPRVPSRRRQGRAGKPMPDSVDASKS
jgi:hypothetical protein